MFSKTSILLPSCMENAARTSASGISPVYNAVIAADVMSHLLTKHGWGQLGKFPAMIATATKCMHPSPWQTDCLQRGMQGIMEHLRLTQWRTLSRMEDKGGRFVNAGITNEPLQHS
jgi:hypothetical protein